MSGLIGHFIGKPLDSSFYGSSATLLGILTTIIATSKSLQGFEPKKDKKYEPKSDITEIDIEGK